MTKGTKTRANGGFTLVEVLVAIAILGVVATSMGGCLVVSQRVNARSQNVIEERAAVTNVVEQLMAEGINVYGSSPYTFSPDDTVTPTEYTAHDTTDSSFPVTITAIEPPEKVKVKKVKVITESVLPFGDALWRVTVECGDVKVVTYIHGVETSSSGGGG